MRRLAAALAALLIACPAVAQQAQSPRALVAPTAPLGDSSDRIANTAFVQSSIGAPALANGQFFIGNISNVAVAHALTGDCTSNNVGLITCTQSAGAFTVNGQLTVNGAIIDTSGNATLKTVILPGSTSGSVTVKAPAVAGANTITLPAGTTDFSATGGTNQFVAQATAGGPFTVVQPSCSSLSGVAASCSTDTTNATNISAGTLGSARLPAFGSGDVSFATGGGAGTIANSAVTLAKMANLTGLSVIGNAGTVAAAPTAVTGTTDQIARINTAGTALAFGSINLAGSGAVGTSILPLANGGSNAALTASNGGLVFSTGSAFSILAGTATAGQIPRSGASTSPTWSTATYPATTAAGTILGSTSANVIAATATPVLGAVGTTGTIGLSGTTSGTATITPQATAGTPTITLPNASGTVAVSGTAPVAVSATTGAITCATCVTSSGGGAITGTAPVVASAAGAISVQGATGQVLTGSGGTGSAFSATPTLGAVGTQGTLALAGTTSGTVTQTTQAAAGAPTVTWGSSTGTPAVTATGPLAITAATGNIACGTCATTTNGGALTATSPVAISAAGVISLTNPLPVANGGTNGTSASGTLLDNITAFASTGFINRTGAGTYSFSSASGILDGIGSTQGNVLFRGAAGWQALAPGTGGQVLTTGGAAANPTWTTVTGTGTVTNVATGWGVTGGPITTTGTVSIATTNPPYGFGPGVNVQLNASVATNALTINVVGNNGSTASATNPVLIPFRDSTLANGDPLWRPVTAALSVTVPSGQTLGTANAVPFRFWIVAIDNAGTVELGVINCLSTSLTAATVFSIQDSDLVSSTAIAAAASAGVVYSTTARTSKAITILGDVEYSSGLTTAGTYATAPTKIHLFGPGSKKPGEVVRTSMGTTASRTLQSAASYAAALSGSITPTSAMNPVRVRASGMALAAAGVTTGFVDLFRGTVAGTDLVSNGFNANGVANTIYSGVAVDFIDAPATTSSQTYTIGVKGDGTNSVGFPNLCAGTSVCATIIMDEIMGANDNMPGIPPLALAG